MLKKISTEKAPAAIGPYSQGISLEALGVTLMHIALPTAPALRTGA